MRRPGRPLSPTTRAWQLDARDWPGYALAAGGGTAAAAAGSGDPIGLSAPARPAPGQPPFLGGLAPSYTLAFVRHLLDGRVDLDRARAVL